MSNGASGANYAGTQQAAPLPDFAGSPSQTGRHRPVATQPQQAVQQVQYAAQQAVQQPQHAVAQSQPLGTQPAAGYQQQAYQQQAVAQPAQAVQQTVTAASYAVQQGGLTGEALGRYQQMLLRIIANVEQVIVGKRQSVELVVMALVAGGHVLLEDMPGTGKTSLVSALAKSITCSFKRIQFTPDVMPSDVTGFSIYNQKTGDFEFRPGAVMSNLVLADEINRASAKTQSAMLEAMEERQVTVDGKTWKLQEPFMVLATQNPVEQYGTYPLPEAQLDRFLIKLSMGYLQLDEEVNAILKADKAKAAIAPAVSANDIMELRQAAKSIIVSMPVARYAVQIASATRAMAECSFGASPRGSKALVSLAQAHALLRGRSYVSPEDIKYLAPYTLCHRIALTHQAKMEGRTPYSVIDSLLASVAVPTMTTTDARGL